MAPAPVRLDNAAVEIGHHGSAERLITYGEAAALVSRASQGLGRILDAIKAEETARGRPDLGLVVSVRTALPAYVGPGEDAEAQALAIREAVSRAWSAVE